MITYRIAKQDDVPSIVQVHLECFPDSMWAFLGGNLISNFYREYITEQNLFIVAINGENIIGFCMGYERPTQARSRFMKKNRWNLIKRVSVGLLSFNHLVYQKVFDAMRTKIKVTRQPTAKGDLLSICVLQDYRGQGIAQELTHQFESLLSKRGISEYTLSVHSNNHRAISFYKRIGLKSVSISNNETIMAKRLY